MDLLPTIIPYKRRTHRKRKPPAASAAPVAALVLVSAAFDDVTMTVALAFDRAVDVSAIEPGQVSVSDAAATGFVWVGAAVDAQPTPDVVVLSMTQAGSAEGPTVLNASATTGIVAADDGAAWAGVTDVELPFP